MVGGDTLSGMAEQSAVGQRIWAFFENTFTITAIGVLLMIISGKILLVIAWVLFVVAIRRSGLFSGKHRTIYEITAALVIAAVMGLWGWKLRPESLPNIDGKASAIVDKMQRHPSSGAEVEQRQASSPIQTTTPRKPKSPTDVQVAAPVFGNLAERAKALSDEIMEDLYLHGWRNGGGRLPKSFHPMPTGQEEKWEWMKSRSLFFRTRFYHRALQLRNEFAQFHLQDEQLELFFKYQKEEDDYNNPIIPIEIEGVAERLKVLAAQQHTSNGLRCARKVRHRAWSWRVGN